MKILFHTIAIEPARWTSERVSRPLTELLGPVAQAGFRELEIYEPHLGAKATSSDILEALRANRQQPVILSSYLNLNPAITTDAEVQEWSEVMAQRVEFYGFGKVRLYWAQAIGHDGSISGTWEIVADDLESASPQWSESRRLADGIMMCKPIVLGTGEWVLPISTWRKTDNSSQMVVSADQGENWKVRGAANVPVEDRTFDEQMFIERKDGRIWMLVRTRYGIGESISTDRGVTWPEVTPSSIPHANARFFITRLQSGNLLLVKHGSMEERTGRSHLMAFISKDDGQTWQGGLLLDERTGISYPDGQQADDGTIYITYDFSRRGDRQILFATFREEDALAGKPVTDAVRLRQLVSQGTGGQPRQPPAPPEARTNEGGAPLRKEPAGALTGEGFETIALESGVQLFDDRPNTSHYAREIPEALSGAQFLRVPMDGTKTLRATRAGMVFALTPQPDRNRDSQAQPLIDQGFRLVALPEFVLLTAASERQNLVSLYQKEVDEGETITIGKWAVPVLFP